MITITPEILTALHQAKMCLPDPTNKELGMRLGITEGSVSRIFTGEAKQVRIKTWAKMEQVISPFVSARTIADATMTKARAMAKQQAALPHSSLPPELVEEINKAAADLCITPEVIQSGLIRSFVRAYKSGSIKSWPPVFDGERL